jgi:hypothetical protein
MTKGNGKDNSAARPFVLFRDLTTRSVKEWLVHKFLGAGEASAFYGKPGDGKSVLAEDLGLHVALGQPWHGRPVRRGAVLFIALERRKLVERRAIAFRNKHGLIDIPFAIAGGMHDFRQPGTANYFADVARQVEQDTGEKLYLIEIDTLSRALCGGDENSPRDMGAIVRSTGILQERTGAHITWLHHTPIEGSERMRGHGALLGAIDTTVHVVKAHDLTRTATVIKANDSEEGEQIAFTLESIVTGVDEEGNETTSPVVFYVSDGPQAARKPKGQAKMPKAAQIALRALTEALDEQGRPAPASNRIPSGVKVVDVSTWRQQAYRRGISTSDEERAKQQAFKRASEHLIGSARVGVWDGQVWTAG